MSDARKVFDDLVRFETVLWATLDTKLHSESGLTMSSFNLMLIIDTTPNCRVLDIAEALAITVGGTSQAVDRLEKAGHCVRQRHPEDRRSSIIELTPAGVEMLRRAEPVFDNGLRQLLQAPLSSVDFGRLAEALAALRHAAMHTPDDV